MKTFSLLPLAFVLASAALADTPASTPAAASSVSVQTSAHPSVQALNELTDAECVEVESYLLRASRAALLAYANAFDEAYQKRDAQALQMLVLGGSPVMLLAMADVPMQEGPADFRCYLQEFYDALRAGMKKRDRKPLPSSLSKTLQEKYPRAVACLPLPCLTLQLDEARNGVEGDFWAQKLTPAEYVAAYRRLADDLPQSMDAARARRVLTRLALKPYDAYQASAVGFFIGGEQEFRFPADARLEYRWQLAEPLPADAPISLEWSEKADVLPPHIPDEVSREIAPDSRVRVATLKGLSKGDIVLRFVFTRPGDAEPLYSQKIDVSIMEPAPEAEN